MKIVLCLGVEELDRGGWRDPEICKKYPGSAYLPHLAANKDILSSGEVFSFDPQETFIVQEELSQTARELIERGAHPAVLLCMESPLFAPLFYDALPELRKIYPVQFLFQGGTDHVHFPSFEPSELLPPLPYDDRRRKICTVISNKHWKAYETVPGWKESREWQKAVNAQLHDQRFLAIHELQKQGLLDLYGKGWPLEMRAPSIPDGEKISVMRQYAMGLCIENTRMNGYVTEKIIDCMVAGVVPIYFGAPDVEKYIPRECFISAMGISWPSDDYAWSVIQAGQRFLRSKQGREFTYRRFARRLLQGISQAVGYAPKQHSYLAESSLAGS